MASVMALVTPDTQVRVNDLLPGVRYPVNGSVEFDGVSVHLVGTEEDVVVAASNLIAAASVLRESAQRMIARRASENEMRALWGDR